MKKLKIKIISSSRLYILFVFVSLFVISGLFLNVNRASATNFTADSIKITTELEIDGKADNLIRYLGDNSKPVTLKVYMTVTSNLPVGTIVTGGDTNNNADTLDTGAFWSAERPIIGFGEILLPTDKTSVCDKSELVNVPVISGKTFLECELGNSGATSFYQSAFEKSSNGNTTLTLGKKYTLNFTINKDFLSKLNITAPKDLNQAVSFDVAPWVSFVVRGNVLNAFLKGPATVVSTDAGKTTYLQYFNSQTDLNNAVQNNVRPSGVPGYGSNTGGVEFDHTGNKIAALINQILGVLIGFLQELIYGIFYWLIAPIIQAMLSIRVYTDTFVAVIYPGWEVIRNICNIFFIVALIVIALATLFRVESYKARPLLVQLILAALMINFSLVIAQAILA
ncbi:MAG: hypothetical protein WC894_06150, partial [Patescibacteria group bacterium]